MYVPFTATLPVNFDGPMLIVASPTELSGLMIGSLSVMLNWTAPVDRSGFPNPSVTLPVTCERSDAIGRDVLRTCSYGDVCRFACKTDDLT